MAVAGNQTMVDVAVLVSGESVDGSKTISPVPEVWLMLAGGNCASGDRQAEHNRVTDNSMVINCIFPLQYFNEIHPPEKRINYILIRIWLIMFTGFELVFVLTKGRVFFDGREALPVMNRMVLSRGGTLSVPRHIQFGRGDCHDRHGARAPVSR